jgi:hypothetical protein
VSLRIFDRFYLLLDSTKSATFFQFSVFSCFVHVSMSCWTKKFPLQPALDTYEICFSCVADLVESSNIYCLIYSFKIDQKCVVFSSAGVKALYFLSPTMQAPNFSSLGLSFSLGELVKSGSLCGSLRVRNDQLPCERHARKRSKRTA